MKTIHKSILLLLALTIGGCGYPAKDLTAQDRQSDMGWVFAIFERNYAPADWKKKNLSVDLQTVKADCLAQAEKSADNAEYFALVGRCVNSFQDAHTGIQMMGNIVPETGKIASLGFVTERVRVADPADAKNLLEGLKVSGLVPGADVALIKKDDVILRVNGADVVTYLKSELIPYGNLGQESSSLTIAAKQFALRSSLSLQPLPSGNIKIEVLREEKIYNFTLPWVLEDALTFITRARSAQSDGEEAKRKKTDLADIDPAYDQFLNSQFFQGFESLEASLNLNSLIKNITRRLNWLLENSFKVTRFEPALQALETASDRNNSEKPSGIVGEETDISNASFKAKIVAREDGDLIGYLRISSFSIGDRDIVNLKAIVKKFNQLKVKKLVVDLLDNGGGSLVHGIQAASILSAKEIAYPKLQIRLNDNWINSLRSQTLSKQAALRMTAKEVLRQVDPQIKSGARLSEPVSGEFLDPLYSAVDKSSCVTNKECLAADVKVVYLVNEMCASMCDIFASIVKDNNMGIIMGSQTMGAGGNVTNHGYSPISKFILRQTESLILNQQGEYLENKGVVPNMVVDTVKDRAKDYKATLAAAVKAMD